MKKISESKLLHLTKNSVIKMYIELQNQNKNLVNVLLDLRRIIMCDTTLNPPRQRERMIDIIDTTLEEGEEWKTS